jgi:NADPH:quinone reductase
MRAAFYTQKGPAPEVLEVGDVPKPRAGPGEVLVAVHASGVNPSDTKTRSGSRGITDMPFPMIIPHQDGAGVIEDVGEGVPPERLGERVWLYEAQLGRPFGSAAQYTSVPEHKAVRLPGDTSFAEGASLGVPALTAHRCVFADGPVKGQSVLVTGGAGAVGFYAIQFAKWGGARVLVTVSTEKQAAIARQAGADVVINRHSADVAAEVAKASKGKARSVHRIVEVAFGANLATSMQILTPGGTIATYASDADAEPRIPFWPLIMLDVTVRFVLVYVMSGSAHEEAVAATTRGLREGWLKHNIAETVPLARIADAHEMVERGVGGKVIVTTAE